MDGYRHRIMDSLLEKKLQAKGTVLIEGPKWCGKTTTAEEVAASKILLARTDKLMLKAEISLLSA